MPCGVGDPVNVEPPLERRASTAIEPPVNVEPPLSDLGGGRLWLFRFLALALVPMVLLIGEGVLRLTDFGHASAFIVPGSTTDVAVSHHRFAWRFFPPALAREPVPFELPAKEVGTRRIFVLGGSAAQGVPEPGFSMGRQLEAMLEITYPEQRFEVINAAMTAINSHVVLPIARDCAKYQPDLFVVYMGNNEVVGPFGAASVFGQFSPRMSWLRLSIALQATRWSQLVKGWGTPRDGGQTWRGMETFLERQVPADDPRLEGVYDHFDHNLRDLVEVARRAGAGIVVSTVASNLNQAPFASQHAADFNGGDNDSDVDDDTSLWQGHVDAGLEALDAGDPAAALESFDRAGQLDDRYAALSFHRARALDALGRRDDAKAALETARDLDTLRFRADSRLNEVIRGLDSEPDLAVVDAEDILLEESSLADRRHFYEHVHFTFEGNTALAQAIFPAVTRLLDLSPSSEGHLPSSRDLAAALAFSPYDALVMERAMLTLVEGPPFVDLWDRDNDLRQRRQTVWQMRQDLDDSVWQHSHALYTKRLASHPEDLLTRRRWAEQLDRRGEHEAAIELWRELIRRYPGGGAWHDALSSSFAALGRTDEALSALAEARRLAPERKAEILINEGRVHAANGNLGRAETLYRQAIDERPEDPVGHYNLAHLAIQRDDLTAAVQAFGDLTQRFPSFALGHYNLGVAVARRGDFEGSLGSFETALALNPHHAASHNSLALSLEQLGRIEMAADVYQQALEVDPGYHLASLNLADLLLNRRQQGDLANAVELYRRGLAQQPNNRAAQRNLARALDFLETTESR